MNVVGAMIGDLFYNTFRTNVFNVNITLKSVHFECFLCYYYKKNICRKDSVGMVVNMGVQNFEKIREAGTYSVVFLSFASVKTGNIGEIKTAFRQLIANVYDSFRHILDSDIFNEGDKEYFQEIIHTSKDDITTAMAVNTLCIYLEKYYGKKVIILLDEYETPCRKRG